MMGKLKGLLMPAAKGKEVEAEDDLLALEEEEGAEEELAAEESAPSNPALAEASDEDLIAELRKRGLIDEEAEADMLASEGEPEGLPEPLA